MKIKQNKVLKACSLSLALLLIGGITTSPIAKTFAQSEANQVIPKTTKTVRIHFNKETKNYSVWVWYDGEDGKEYKFNKKDSYGPYIELEVSKDVKTINYIIADIANGWKKDVEQNRIFNLKDNDTTEIWVKSGVVEHYVTNPNGQDNTSNSGNDSDGLEKSNKTVIRIYYLRKDVRGWEVWLYNDNYELVRAKFDKTDSKGRKYAEISLDGKCKEVRYFIAKDNGAIREYEGTKDQNGYRTLIIKDDKAEDLVRASNEPDLNEKETITFRVKNAKEGYGIWYWHEGEEGKFLELIPGEDGYSYATTEVPKGLDEIPFFVTNRKKDENGEWMRDIGGADKRNRTLYPKHQKGIEFEFGNPSTKTYNDKITKTTRTEIIQAKVRYQADEKVEFGQQKVEKSPVDGEKEVTTVSEPGKDPVVTEKVTKEPENGLTKVGNKQVETKENANGSTTTTTTIYEVNPKTGKLENPTATTKTSMPAGTIEDIAKTTKIERKTIPGKVTYEADESLNFKEKKEEKTPVDGEKEVTTVSESGKDPVVTEKVTKEPENGLTKVGNKQVETKENANGSTTTTTTIYEVNPKTGKLENPTATTKTSMPAGTIEDIAKTTKTKTEIVPGKIKYQADDNLAYGTKEVVKAPVDGEKEITIVSQPGKEDEVIEKTIKEAKDGLTKVGNKQVETKENANGSTTTTTTIYEVNPKTGKLENPTATTKTSMPAGTIEDIAKTTKTKTEIVPGKIKYQADDNLAYGTKEVVKAPVDGEKEITIVSQPGKEDEVIEKTIKEAKDGLTKVGNKQVETKKNADGSTTTTTTTYQVDPDTGELTNPNKTIKTSMPAGTIEDIAKTTKIERKTIPGKVTYEADESLNFKEKKEETTPVDGEKEITIVSHPGKKDIVTEKTIKEAKDGLTKVGNKKVETKTNADGSTTTTTTIYKVNPDTGKLENPTSTRKTSMPAGTIEDIAKTRKVTTKKVPGKVRYQADENVEFGQQKVEKAPVDGEKEITTVSQPGKEDEVIEKTIKEAKDGLTKVGNKQVETKENADGSTTIITTIYEVNPKTGKLEKPTTTTEKTEPEQPSEPSKQEYLLIFNGNAGSPAGQRVKVKDGEKIEVIKEPTRDGYKFIKWVILGTDKTFDLNDKFNKDVLAKDDKVLMLTAVWEKVEKDTKPGKDLEEKPGKKDPEKEKPGKKEPEKEKPSKSKKDRDDDYYWVYYNLRANNFKELGKTCGKNLRLKRNYDALKKAYNKNLITSKAARYLLDKYPETVKSVRHELEKLLERSEILRKEAYELLKKLENCYDY
ncbi:pullulanase-associated domain-containing protein [uncultured Anaerococcus sp.]|uniref:pullulanase-associated domain-containing protein n=1 Tax=uncultured Anaerococcus sp. TaxID=293428 RepID=UPI00288BC0BB|nr:G5 domain-containing protein [uncultured Anaerococcus sp.]